MIDMRANDWPCPPRLAILGFAAVALGTMPGSMDTSVNAAFPVLTRDFALTLEDIRWIVIPWVLAQVTLTLAFGHLGDRRGHKPVFMAGMACAALAHAACALAQDFTSLALLRFAQGIGVGLGIACAPALATQLFPPRLQRRVVAVYVSAFGLGAALGPLVGGALLDRWGWPAVFWFRVPIALLALLLIAPVPVRRPASTMGAAGFRSDAASKAAEVPNAGAGPKPGSSERTVGTSVFLQPSFIGLQAIWIAANLAVFSILLLGPFLLGARESLHAGELTHIAMSYQQLGLLLSLTPAGSVLAGLGAALFAGRLDSLAQVRAGLAISAASLVAVGFAIGLPGDAALAIAFLMAGVGLGLLQIGYMDLTLSLLPESARGVAGSLVNVTRLAGIVGSVVVLFALQREFAAHLSPVESQVRTFFVTGAALALVAVGALRLRIATR